MRTSKIAILSTVVNFELYSKTSPLFPQRILHYVIDGTNGMHGLDSIFYTFQILKNRGIDWLIMADEDVIFQDTQRVLDLIAYMETKNFQVAGIREGGVISHKPFNPYAVNTFFSILHFSEIEKVYNKNEVNNNQYIKNGEFSDDLSQLSKKYNVQSLYEPYYRFYFWLKRKGFNFLYLDADSPFVGDDITTSVYDPEGKLLLYHTWYARAYGTNEKHTKRINKVLDLIEGIEKPNSSPIIFKDRTYVWKLGLKKNLRKLRLRIKRMGC